MNLENLNLVELNAQELQEVDGGIFGIDDLTLVVVGAIIGAALTQDLDKLKEAWDVGYKAGRN